MNIALNKALRDDNPDEVLNNAKNYVDKKSEFMNDTFRASIETAIKEVCENISSGLSDVDNRLDFYDQVKISLENSDKHKTYEFDSRKEYVAKMEKEFESKSEGGFEDYLVNMGLLKLTDTDGKGLIRRGIGLANNLTNRIFIHSEHYGEKQRPSFDSQFIDDIENYLKNTGYEEWQAEKEVYNAINLSMLKYHIDRTQNRYKLLKVLLQNKEQTTNSYNNKNVALLEEALASFDY